MPAPVLTNRNQISLEPRLVYVNSAGLEVELLDPERQYWQPLLGPPAISETILLSNAAGFGLSQLLWASSNTRVPRIYFGTIKVTGQTVSMVRVTTGPSVTWPEDLVVGPPYLIHTQPTNVISINVGIVSGTAEVTVNLWKAP